MVEEVDLEEGEVTESEEEQSGEEENHLVKPAKSANPPPNKLAESARTEKKDSAKLRRNEVIAAATASDSKKELPRKQTGARKGERKRNDDREPRGFEKSRRKSAEADPEASFEDELDAYQNSQRSLPRGRDREPLESRDTRRRPSPNSRRPRGGRAGGPRSNRPPRESAEVRPSRKEKRVPCKFFLEGRCKFGDDCPFSHDVLQTKKLEACKFYAGGACNKGPLCVYMHQEFPCKFFHTGQKCFSGDNCRFTHDRLSADQKLALENYLEKENKFKDDRHHPRENPHRSPPLLPQQEEYRDPSRAGLLPTPPDGSTGFDNSRRRPDFFRETLPDRRSQEPRDFRGADPHIDRNGTGFDRHRDSFDNQRPANEGMYGRGPSQEHFPFLDSLPSSRPYGDVLSPRGSEHSEDAFPSSVAPQAPRLLARLQQRAQQMMLPEKPEEPVAKKADEEFVHQMTANDYPPDESPERHLVINEPTSQEPPALPQGQDSQSSISHWGGSDDEDDGSDQFLANSLKRQQEPNRGPWNRYEGEWRSLQEFQLYAEEPFMGEQLLNRGKVLLSVPLPPEQYYPPQQEFLPAYVPQGPEYGDPQWGYQDPPMAYYPPEPYHDPHAALLPPVAGAVDPRLARAGNFDYPYPPHEPEMMHQHVPAEPQIAPTLEAVMQKLLGASGLSPTIPLRPVVAPEIEGSLEKNPEPPMYRLELLVTRPAMDYNAALYQRLLVFRSAEDLAIDPRIAKITKSLTVGPPPAPQSAPSVSPVAATKPMFSLEPTEVDESKKASQDFDAITAMLAQALKKREAEGEGDKASPEKKMRRVVASSDTAYAVS